MWEKRQKLLDAHQPEVWIADAARRVTQIQLVTHALKFTHPDAKGTSISSYGNAHVSHLVLGTHSLADQGIPDVVGNAAALDVNKFLRMQVDGKTLLQRASEGDDALLAAFSPDRDQAKEWVSAFAGITEDKLGGPASHKLAKQVYWPLPDGGYHLLAPLFPTSLVHEIWGRIREDRFSEMVKEARQAHRTHTRHSHGYCEYPGLTVQKFGGTKPQNISQLNSERNGENYLLPSCPPTWRSETIRLPLGVSSIFAGWLGRRKEVRDQLRTLRGFLVSVQQVNNMNIRQKRAELVGYICDELLNLAAEIQNQPSGWSRQAECRLNRSEQCWLDPGRAEEDAAFASIYERGEWCDEITRSFGNWLCYVVPSMRESESQ